MIIVHRNYRSYDEVMIKLQYDKFVMIYDHHNIFRKYGHWSFSCLWFMNMHIFMNMFGNRSIGGQYHLQACQHNLLSSPIHLYFRQ